MMRYDVERRVWDVMNVRAEKNDFCCRYEAHPWDSSKAIQFKLDGTIAVISLVDGAVVKQYTAKYDGWGGIPETIVFGVPGGEFVAVACNGYDKEQWRVFTSADDKWTDIQWPTTNKNARTAFYDPKHKQLYYHIHDEDKFTVVTLT